jgi:GNAT superfamily N-acetyltransferase
MTRSIRPATPDDAPTVLHLIRKLARYEREPEAVEATAERLREQLSSPKPPFECLLAFDEDGAVGFALFVPNYSTWKGLPGYWLEDLFVLPKHRRKGHGKALFEAVSALAQKKGFARIEWSVLDWNETAHRFYERLGARPLLEWTTWRADLPPVPCTR